MKKLYKGLIGGGIALLVIAFFMDTTVSTRFGDVHNIGLISKQQNYIFLGGILLIAGVITFAAHKNNQTPEDKAKEDAKDKEEKEKIDQTFAKIEKSVSDKSSAMAGTFSSWFSPRSEKALIRGIVGLFVGISLSVSLGKLIHPLLWLIFPVLFLWLVFRPIPAAKAMQGPLLTNTICFGLLTILFSFFANELRAWSYIINYSALTIISVVGYLVCRKSLKPKPIE